MSKLTIFVSATIVLIFVGSTTSVYASPQNQVPEDHSTVDNAPSLPPSDDFQISKPPPLPTHPAPMDAHYYPYQQQLTLRDGAASDFPKINFKDSVLGFQYAFPKFISPKWEAGADLHSGGKGHLNLGARWIFNERGYFRPSLKVGGDVLLDGSQNLATFGLLQNYYLRSTATLEQVIWNPYSIRLEFELMFGSKNTILELTTGISRGW